MFAGFNELNFRSRLKNKIKSKIQFGTRSKGNVNISVDGHFEYNGKLYLIEIDSGNEAKLLVGQYLLINMLFSQIQKPELKKYSIDDCKFIIVHYYDNYNVSRTINNLNLAQKTYNTKLPFTAVYKSDFKDWDGFLKLVI